MLYLYLNAKLSLSYRRSFDQRKYTLEEVDQPKINIKELLAFYIHILKNFRSLSSDFKTKYIGLLDVVLKGYYIAIVWGSFLSVYSPKSFICYQGYSLGSFFKYFCWINMVVQPSDTITLSIQILIFMSVVIKSVAHLLITLIQAMTVNFTGVKLISCLLLTPNLSRNSIL